AGVRRASERAAPPRRRPMKLVIILAATCCALAPAASAQFSQFNWILDNPNGLYATLTPSVISLSGGLGGLPSGSEAQYSTVSPVDAIVSVHVETYPLDGECGASYAFLGEAGQLAHVTDCYFDAPLGFPVHAGAEIVFGLHVTIGSFPGTVDFTNF